MNDLLLLATLLGGPLHGYALKKLAGQLTGQGEMHNNLVYPLLKRFVAAGWANRRTVPGERGQTRELYALTAKGRQELVGRLREFTPKDAGNENAFHLRVGLFSVLDAEAREEILKKREEWLTERGGRLAKLAVAMNLGEWGGEVVGFRRSQIGAEKRWLAALRRKAKRERKPRSN